MNQSTPSLTVVSVNWNRREDIKALLESLKLQTDQSFETIIVDNASTDGSQESIKNDYPAVELLQLGENLGIPAINLGVAKAVEEYVVLLDNDVTLSSEFVERLKRVISSNPDIKVFALNIVRPDGERQKDYLPQHAKEPKVWHNFIGGGVVFNRQLFNDLGGYSQDYFIYVNETELSARILAAGEKILYCPDIRVTHKTSSQSRSSATAFYHYVKNSLLFFSTYYPPRERVDLTLGFVLINLKKSIREKLLSTLIKGIADNVKRKRVAAVQLSQEDRDCLRLCWQGDPSLSAMIKKRLDVVFR